MTFLHKSTKDMSKNYESCNAIRNSKNWFFADRIHFAPITYM